MQNLVIMPQEEGTSKFTKNGRELQELLGSKDHHTDWAKDQVRRLRLKPQFDYQVVSEPSHNHLSRKTYFFTEAAAHRIATHTEVKSENTSMIRDNYALTRMVALGNEDAILIQAFSIMQGRMESYKAALEEAQPKLESYKQFLDSTGLIPMDEAAIKLNTGRNSLMAWMREQKILTKKNVPYVQYADNGFFKVKVGVYPRQGELYNYSTTFVTPKGLEFLRRKLRGQVTGRTRLTKRKKSPGYGTGLLF